MFCKLSQVMTFYAHIWRSLTVSLMWPMTSDIYDVSHLHIWEKLFFLHFPIQVNGENVFTNKLI